MGRWTSKYKHQIKSQLHASNHHFSSTNLGRQWPWTSGGCGTSQRQGIIESKIGARIPDNPSHEDLIKLKQLEIEQEQLLLQYTLKQKELEIEESKLLAEMHRASQESATHRWQSDMGSDSKLSKNIRPGTLVYILTAYLLFALLSAMGIDINEAYVKLLGEWGQLVMLAYFGGRSVEKIFEMRMHGQNKKEDAK